MQQGLEWQQQDDIEHVIEAWSKTLQDTEAYLQCTANQRHHITVHDQCGVQSPKHCSQVTCTIKQRTVRVLQPACRHQIPSHTCCEGKPLS